MFALTAGAPAIPIVRLESTSGRSYLRREAWAGYPAADFDRASQYLGVPQRLVTRLTSFVPSVRGTKAAAPMSHMAHERRYGFGGSLGSFLNRALASLRSAVSKPLVTSQRPGPAGRMPRLAGPPRPTAGPGSSLRAVPTIVGS